MSIGEGGGKGGQAAGREKRARWGTVGERGRGGGPRHTPHTKVGAGRERELRMRSAKNGAAAALPWSAFGMALRAFRITLTFKTGGDLGKTIAGRS